MATRGNGSGGPGSVKRVMVATDRSETADRAVRWAANMADRYASELLVLQVILVEHTAASQAGQAAATRASAAAAELTQYAQQLAGDRALARVIVHDDPAMAILEVAEESAVDVLVVGNAGMSGRKEFLLGNVPNRISHNARCTVIIVNTANLDTNGNERRSSIASVHGSRLPEAQPREPRLMGRALDIAGVMTRYGIKELFGRSDADKRTAHQESARRLRGALEELGPTFAKLGQILSTRPDLLPPAFIEELATLQDSVPPLTEAQVVGVMEEELGVPWEDVFESIDPQPMAAGTIAEVHRATLADGSRVVVKVQRPGARTDIMKDLGLLELFAQKTQARPGLRQMIDMPAVFEHLSVSLQRELDFRGEAANINRMRTILEPYARLDVPDVYGEISTERLLVMEEIRGVPIREAPAGEERAEAARQLLESYYAQILTVGFFHADPHPGNLMWWKDKIFFLDFGMVGEIGPEVRELMLLMLMALWQEDIGFLSEVVLLLAGDDAPEDLDMRTFEHELGVLMAPYRHASLKEIQLGPMLQGITELASRHDVRLPAALALTGKALAQMQLATAELDPELDPFSVVGGFLFRAFGDRFRAGADPKRLFYEAQKLRVRATRLVVAFERMTGARPGPRFQVDFRGTGPLEETIRRAARRLALAATGGAAIVATGFTASTDQVDSWVPITLGSTGGALIVLMFADLFLRR